MVCSHVRERRMLRGCVHGHGTPGAPCAKRRGSFGNVFNTYVLEGQPADVWEQTKELNDSAKTSPLLGFSFDPDPVATEITNISTVVKQYESLVGGELRVEETNAEFVEQLKVAGVDTVIEEMQKQVDEFMASK